jgi:RNA-directed DNA polymerase
MFVKFRSPKSKADMLAKQISQSLGFPLNFVTKMGRKADHSYKVYTIPKRGGGKREIHHPSRQLKCLQRWLVTNVIEKWPVHQSALAYRPGRSIAENAKLHAPHRFLLRMDFKGFFPSITKDDIESFLEQTQAGIWDLEDRKLFTSLVCRNGVLTIGAPTSPALSNALCFEMDSLLFLEAAKRQATYSRYADDLFFSIDKSDVLKDFEKIVESVIRTIPFPAGLSINSAKTRHASKRGRRQATGLVLQSDGNIGVGRDRKRFVRGLIHRYDKLTAEQKDFLAGMLSFIQSIDPDFINSLVLKYGPDKVERCRKPVMLHQDPRTGWTAIGPNGVVPRRREIT